MAKRLWARAVDSRVAVLLDLDRFGAARLDPGQFQLLTENLCEFLEGYVDLQDVFSRLVSRLWPRECLLTTDGLPLLAFSQSDSILIGGTEPEVGDVDLRQGDAHNVLSLASEHLSLRDVLLQVFPDLAANDVPEPIGIWIYLSHDGSPQPIRYPWCRRGQRCWPHSSGHPWNCLRCIRIVLSSVSSPHLSLPESPYPLHQR